MPRQQKINLKSRGLYTDPNQLSGVPEGSAQVLDNCVIDRENVTESRRGNAKYGNDIGSANDRAQQLLSYKGRVLPHFSDNKLYFNQVAHTENTTGNFLAFAGTYSEVDPGLRIKAVESNKNLYFTTSEGIKKIAARNADDFTTSAGFIVDAGVLAALDLTGQLDFTTDGFLPPLSKVAYEVVWSYRDINNNLLPGAPSSRFVITNFSTVSANVELEFTIPDGATDSYFYQVYRTAIFTQTDAIPIDEIDPGQEFNLVIEDFPTSAQLMAGIVEVTDIAPEEFRNNGLPLYTNPQSGQGINQANYPPPKAKDLAMYQNTVFYANTETKASKQINLLTVQDFVSNTSYIEIISGVTTNQYIFVGAKENTEINFSAYTGAIPADTNSKYWLINAASNIRKYYVWYDDSLTTQTLDFTNYIGTIPTDLDTRYCIIYVNALPKYYVWYDATGTSVDPGLNPDNTQLAGLISIKVDISTGITTAAQVADETQQALTLNNVFNDYDVNYTPASTLLTIDTLPFDDSAISGDENVQKGFTYTIDTPVADDPGTDPGTYTDTVGRIGFRVKVGRLVTTKAELADATAAAIEEQDAANDFTVSYTPSAQLLTVQNSNNGKADNAVDSAINGLADSFAITVLSQGDGEDAALGHVLISALPTPAQQIDETAQSLVRVINLNSSELVYATYLSGPNDLPGQILLTAKSITTTTFNLDSDTNTTGASFNPPLPPAGSEVVATNELKPNRLYWAKTQQPEAVPLVNYIDLGPEDQPIYRILALREALFILKTDGVYRLTGQNGNWSQFLMDGNCEIISPDSAVTLNNEIYCLTTQGVVKVTDTGVTIISERIGDVFNVITSDQYDFETLPFGVSYETDRAYIIWMPSEKDDTVATQAFRYSYHTDTWVRWPISKTCGIVNQGDNRLYLGPSDENFIERERKNFDRTDYADRQYDYTLGADEVDGTEITLPSANITEPGYAIVQTQYLTIDQYNGLLRKLDLDPFVGAKEAFTIDFTSYVGSIPSALHEKFFIMYSARDAIKYVVFYDADGDVEALSPAQYPEVIGATQIRVDISSGVTTTTQLANATWLAILTSTNQFSLSYSAGTFLTAQCIISGITTNPSDSTNNPVSNGFSITVNTQGYGSYYDTLQAVPGNDLKVKIQELAAKLDLDPGVAQTDFTAAIGDFSGTGQTVVAGNPTLINDTSHGLTTYRIAVLTNSTSVVPNINGTYQVTVNTVNQFSIPITTSVGGTVDWVANSDTPLEVQGLFNAIVYKLNNDSSVGFTNYQISSGTTNFEVLITDVIVNDPTVTVQYETPFVAGPIVIYEGIANFILYTPDHFGDPSITKQVSEGTFIFQNATFSGGTVGFSTDLSPGIAEIDFEMFGKGDFGLFPWGQQNWGGGFSGVPFRTYIPLTKQRCRYIQPSFENARAREMFGLYGYSLTFTPKSTRGYRT